MAANDGSVYIKNLLTAATGTGDGTQADMAFFNTRGMYGACQCSGISTATVNIKGRVNSNHTWKTIHQFTSDDAVEIVLFPEMIASVADYTSGTIYVDIIGESRK